MQGHHQNQPTPESTGASDSVDVAVFVRRAEAAERRATALQLELAAIQGSWVWRLSRPVRWVSARLSGSGVGRGFARLRKAHSVRQEQQAAVRSGFWNRDWYLEHYPDVAAAGVDPLKHYLATGAREGRDPSAEFSSAFYLAEHDDVANLGMNPLVHYALYGQAEGRNIQPSRLKRRRVFDQASSDIDVARLRAGEAATRLLERRPLVSVVMPTRNRAHSIGAAIASVVAQGYPHWELFVIDDGSTDSTPDVLAGFAGDKRIHVLVNDGKGVCAARNAGLDRSSGEFISYLDSDNTWQPDYLELMLLTLEDSDADCGYCALRCIVEDEKSAVEPEVFYRQEAFDFDALCRSNFIDLNVFLHKRVLFDELGGFDPVLQRMVDWDLILRYTRDHRVAYGNFVGANYDAGPAPDRITNAESVSWQGVVRNKHLIDWSALNDQLGSRDTDLVSVIICVYGQARLTQACLESLFTHQPGVPMEVVIVDNGSDAATKRVLDDWASRSLPITLVRNPENYNFSLGNNLGFAASTGARVVFLNNDTVVTPEWLRALVRPLAEPAVLGAQPKLLYPDGCIQGAGVVFSSRSALGYPIYMGFPGDYLPTQVSRRFAAVTAACLAMRAADFARAGGFDALFINGQEDIDLCLRLGDGRAVFDMAPDSVVFHHEGKTPGRNKRMLPNRQLFVQRWAHLKLADDTGYYKQDGLVPPAPPYRVDNPDWSDVDYGVWRPDWSEAAVGAAPGPAVTADDMPAGIVIRIGCPDPAQKDQWGDYHFAVSLVAALARQGVPARISFLRDWEQEPARTGTVDAPAEINLVLRGLSAFKPQPGLRNLLWMISHPDKISDDELNGFDHVFVASETWADELAGRLAVPVSTLLQCTDVTRFMPGRFDASLQSDALFVANSRKVLRPVVKAAVEAGVRLDIHGQLWEGLAPVDWVRSSGVSNIELPAFYASASVVLNDHWDSMRSHGFVSNRVFDVLACGAPLVTDSVAGFPADLAAGCSFFDRDVPLPAVLERSRRDPRSPSLEALRLAEQVRRDHSFDARARQILSVLAGQGSNLPGSAGRVSPGALNGAPSSAKENSKKNGMVA